MKIRFKNLLSFCIAIFICCNTFCQSYDANWVFGDHAGLKFEDGEITPFETSINSIESSASISDGDGNLLFYTDGITIWNKNHLVMENGDSLYENYLGEFDITSCTQGSLIIPQPGSDSLFYVFSLSPFASDPGLIFSIVDMSLNFGTGSVISKSNILLAPQLTEKLCGVKHGNGKDWWIIGHKRESNNFYKFLLTTNGIYGPYSQAIGTGYFGSIDQYGELESSTDGDKIIGGSYDTLNIFDFNRCNGELENCLTFTTPFPSGGRSYSLAFSPNKNFAFISTWEKQLYQLNLIEDGVDFGEWILIYETNIPNYVVGQIQEGPDHKIYIATPYSGPSDSVYSIYNMNLSVINFPDLSGLSCDLDTNNISLLDKKVIFGLPNMPNYNLGPLAGSECDTLGTAINNFNEENKTQIAIRVYPNPVFDILTLHSNNNSELHYEIKSIQGQIIESGNFIKQVNINFKNYLPGIYIIEISDLNNKLIQADKIVKD